VAADNTTAWSSSDVMPNASRPGGDVQTLPLGVEAAKRLLAQSSGADEPTTADQARQRQLLLAATAAARTELAEIHALLAEHERSHDAHSGLAATHRQLDAATEQLTELAQLCAQQLRSLELALDRLEK
jgi:hypothetical protein